MPFNGSGTFSRLYSWVVDAANSVNISSTRTDAEMNGFAAGLTNCITRDGQSPPSADIPMGGKRLVNLGAATVGTDALNRDTADARYIITAATAVSLAGSLSVATTLAVTGTSTLTAVNASGSLSLTTNNTTLNFTDLSGTHPNFICQNDNNFVFYGTDAAGAQRAIFSISMRSSSATFGFAVGVTIAGTLAATGAITCPTPTAGDNSTKSATTAFVVTSYAPLASPTLTGTPAAPTAAAGTATTQIATTAFADALRDVPQNAQTANYALALTDRGKGVDFNGTSLTCTIPANASVAFPVGSTIVVTNINASALSIAITTDTLTLAGTVTTGTRTLAQNGVATLRKISATSWLISGAGLS